MLKRKQEVQEKANFTQTKVDFEEYRKLFSLRTKVMYRLTHPAVVVSSLLYFCLMAAFIVCYILGRQNPCDSSSTIGIVLLNGDPGIDCMFLIPAVLANYVRTYCHHGCNLGHYYWYPCCNSSTCHSFNSYSAHMSDPQLCLNTFTSILN